jgi:hypothetical protein
MHHASLIIEGMFSTQLTNTVATEQTALTPWLGQLTGQVAALVEATKRSVVFAVADEI